MQRRRQVACRLGGFMTARTEAELGSFDHHMAGASLPPSRSDGSTRHRPLHSAAELTTATLESVWNLLFRRPMKITAKQALQLYQPHLTGHSDLDVADERVHEIFRREIDKILNGTSLTAKDVVTEMEFELLPRELFTYPVTRGMVEDGLHSLRHDLAHLHRWCFDFLDEAPLTRFMRSRVDELLRQVRAAPKPIIFVNSTGRHPYGGLLDQLVGSGHDAFIVARGTQSLPFSEYPRSVGQAVRHQYHLNALEMVDFFSRVDHGVVMFVTECYINHRDEGIRSCAQEAYVLAQMRLCKIPKIIFLYDVMTQFDRDLHLDDDYIHIHRSLLNESDGIILSANTQMAADHLRHVFQIEQPMMAFHRYNDSQAPAKRQKREGFHVALVGPFFSNLYLGTRNRMRELAPQMMRLLDQGIHLHTYVEPAFMRHVRTMMTPWQREHFHVYECISDQAELIAEVSQCDAGWMVHNTQIPMSTIARSRRALYRDSIFMFHLSTVPSSILLFGSAGLPMFVSRSEQGILREFGRDAIIPIESAELERINEVIAEYDWDKLRKTAESRRELFGVATHAKRFEHFLDRVREKERTPSPPPPAFFRADGPVAAPPGQPPDPGTNPWGISGQSVVPSRGVPEALTGWLEGVHDRLGHSPSAASVRRELEEAPASLPGSHPYAQIKDRLTEVLAGTQVAADSVLEVFEGELIERELHTYAAKLVGERLSRTTPSTVDKGGLAREVLANAPWTQRMRSKVDAVLARVQAANQPIVFLNNIHRFQYTPMLEALEASGRTVFYVCRGYAETEVGNVLRQAQHADQRRIYLNAFETADLLERLEHGVVVVNSESYLSSHFDGLRAVAAEAYLTAMLRITKRPSLLLLYDMVSPFLKNAEYESAYDTVHGHMVRAATSLVLNSNTSMAVEFVKRCYSPPGEVLSFPRYNTLARRFPAARTDGFHLAMAGGFLSDAEQPALIRHMSESVEALLRQGVHVHYYGDRSNADSFARRLGIKEAQRFHRHTVVRDQRVLVEELSHYHAGWMVHSTYQATRVMDAMKTQRMKDAVYVFMLSTVPSSLLLYACAGLPIFINRSMQGVVEDLVEDSVIPVEASEIEHLETWIGELDWEDLRRRAQRNAPRFSMESRFPELDEVLRRIESRPPQIARASGARCRSEVEGVV